MGLLLFSTLSKSQTPNRFAEICDNGIDDDGDGLIDGFDPDCIGTGTNCSGNFGDNLFLKGDFGTTADGRNPTQPNPADNGTMVLGNPLPAGATSYNFGFNLSEGCPTGRNCWINDGAYIIATNSFGMLNPPNTNWYAWQRIADNSGRADGYMMIVNAGLQPDIFFKQTIRNLCPNTTYYFSIDVINLFLKNFTAIQPDISFVMGPEGTSLATLKTQPALYSTGDIPQDEQWHSYGFAFVTPPDVTSAEFAIRNNNPGGYGNDLCLDNIRLRPCFPNIDLKVNKNLLCANENLTLTVQTGSRLKYFYQWQFSSDGGNTWQNLTGKIDDICTIPNFQTAHEGMYRVIASPNPTANCRYTSPPVAVTLAPPVSVSIRGKPQFCAGDSLVLDAFGNFKSYNWSNGANSATIRIKQAGNYEVTVTDRNGCVGQTSFQTTILLAAVPTLKGNPQFCSGDSTILEVQGDFQNYTWSNGEISQKITVKQSGSYSVTVTDRNGCKGQVGMQITVSPSLSPTIKGTLQFCNGDSSVLEIQGNFQNYTWSNGEISPKITVKQSGEYAVTATDKNGCTSQAQVKTTVAASLAVVIKGNPQFCSGDSTILEVQGNFQNYIWSNGEISPKITVKQAGNYGVTVVDKSGCKGQSNIQVSIPPSLISTIKGNFQFCSGDSTVLEVQGEFQNYTWSNGGKTAKIIVKSSGNYAVSTTDKNGCKSETAAHVTMTPSVNATIKGNTSFCTGDNTALEVEGEFQKYDWSNGEKTPVIQVKDARKYAVSVTDINGCKGETAVQTTLFPSVQTTFKIEHPTCAGAINGQIKVHIETGTPPYTFQWQQGANTPSLTHLKAGQYVLTVQDSAHCSHHDTLILFETAPIHVQNRMISPNCYGETLGKIQFDNIAGGTGGFNIAWNNSRFDTVKTLPLVKDSMRLGIHFFTVKDRNGCLFTDSVGVYNIRIKLSLNLGNDQVVLLGDNLNIIPLTNFQPASFQWLTEGDTLTCPRCRDINIQPLKKYNTYILRAKDSLNCPVSDTLNVRVQNLKRVFIPTAFSPNDDNMNDFFTVFGAKEVSQIAVFKIFDRWGELVWQTQNLQPNTERLGWDGTFKGMQLSPAVYVYYALVEFVDGEREVYAGDVTLVK